MKKLFSLVAIAAVALTSFTSCSNNDKPAPVPNPTKAKLTLSADAKVAVDASGKFTVTSDIAAPEAIVVAVTSSDAKVLTVSTASVTIPKGQKSIDGAFKGIADGKATITIAATGVTLSVASINVTVGTKPAGDVIMIGGFSSDLDGASPLTPINNSVIDKDATFIDICLASPDGVKALNGDACDNWVSGCLWYHTNLWTEISETAAKNTSLDNYGCDIVGTQANATSPLYYTIFEENTVIDDKLTWVQNSGRGDEFKGYNGADAKYYMAPYIYSDQFPDTNKGKSGYVIAKFSYKNSAEDIEFGFYRGWAKVSISDAGVVTVENVAICIGDGEFKTGQKQ